MLQWLSAGRLLAVRWDNLGRIPLTSAALKRLCLLSGSQQLAAAQRRTVLTVTPTLEEHLGTVYRYALRLTGRADLADDLTQETMLRACRSWRTLRDERIARVWLLRIATNLWNDQLRRAKFRPRVLVAEPECPRRSPGNASDERETVALALAAMNELPPRQRQVLHLITCEELTHADVAEVLGIDAATNAAQNAARDAATAARNATPARGSGVAT